MSTDVDRPSGTAPRTPWSTSAVTLRDLPLRYIDLGTQVRPSEWREGNTWPPTRLDNRQDRLAVYEDLHLGSVSRFFSEPDRVPVTFNFARRFVATTTELLLSVRPSLEPDPHQDDRRASRRLARRLYDATDDALLHCLRDGLCYIVAFEGDDGVTIFSPPAASFYSIVGGGWIWTTISVGPEDGDNDDIPTQLRAWLIDPDGTVWQQDGTWEGSRNVLGHTIGVQGTLTALGAPVEIGRAVVTTAARSPRTANGWGTSLLDDMISLSAAFDVRMGSMARILDAHEHPMVAWWASDDDLDLLAPSGTPPSDRRLAVEAGATRWRDHDVNIVPGAVQRVEYLTWDGELAASSAYLDRLDMVMRFMSNVPAILESSGGIPSGVALRRLLLPLYGSIKALQFRVHDSLEAALNDIGFSEAEVIWPNILDELDAEAEADHTEPPGAMSGAPAAEDMA